MKKLGMLIDLFWEIILIRISKKSKISWNLTMKNFLL